MHSDHGIHSKVVRYSGSKQVQIIQYDGNGRPLYTDHKPKHICESSNLDICVSDYPARAVVVVNQFGKLRFRHIGHPSNTEDPEPFYPMGIATDSQSHILIADWDNDRIHIIDQDGQFIRYICDLRRPYGLCIDIRDNIFVAECDTSKVK
jgi:streptogramin lyase